MALGQPVWSRVDEPAHYDVIAQYAAGVYPHDSETTVRPETLAIMTQTGVYGFVVDNAYQRPDPTQSFASMPAGLDDAQHVLWVRRHGWQYSYEAFQPPLYYALALPAFEIGDAIGGAFGALYAVRLFDALLAALLAPFAMLIALRLWPAQPTAGWGAAVLTAALPGVDVNLTSVTNDVLVCVLGGLTLVVAISARVTWRRAALVGLLLGAAMLTKTTAIAIVPAVIAAMLLRARGGRPRAAAIALAIAAALVVPWLVSNVAIYGEAITTREQVAMSAFPARTAAFDFWSVSTLHSMVTFWSGDPFLSLPTAVPLSLLAVFLSALALAGLWRAWRSGSLDRNALVVLMLAAVGAAFVSVASPVLAAFNAPGRLAYVALAAVTASVACGLWLELRSERLRRAAVGLFAAVSLLGMGLLGAAAPPQPSGPGRPDTTTYSSLAADAYAGRVHVGLEGCAVDAQHDVWVQVLIQNFSDSPAEWSQSVDVRAAGATVTTSDYSRSTQLPMTIAAGDEAEGWLWLGPRAALAGRGELRLVFHGVAADNYASIDDFALAWRLC